MNKEEVGDLGSGDPKSFSNSDNVSIVHETRNIVQFENDAASLTSEKVGDQDPSVSLMNEDTRTEIRDFLSRPIPVAQFTWLAADAVGTILTTINVPNYAFNSNMVSNKLQHFRFFRARTHCKIIVNARQFDIGRLWVVWEPVPNARGIYGPPGTLTNYHGYPTIELDVGTGNSIEFSVPFTNYVVAHDLVNADPQKLWGRFRVIVINQLAGEAAPTADVSLYCWFSDISLTVPTYNVVPQGTDESHVESSTGSISKPLSVVSKVAGVVGGVGLGPISTFATGVSWVTALASKAAALFGYSKPDGDTTLQRVTIQPTYGYTNYDAVDDSAVLGGHVHNEVEQMPRMYGSEYDEMDISYITARPNFYGTVTWDQTQSYGDIIDSWPVTPGLSATFSNTACSPTLLAWVANSFRLWRGELVYRFSVVANRFYSGRLGIAYLPGVMTAPAAMTDDILEAIPYFVCDIKQTRDCVISVPYLAQNPMLETRVGSLGGLPPIDITAAIDVNNTTGVLVLFVVNGLRFPSNLPTSVPINLYIGAGPDIEFANPRSNSIMPWFDTVPPPAPLVVQPQGIDEDFATPSTFAMQHGNRPAVHHILAPKVMGESFGGRVCAGERVVNLRCLTRMFSHINRVFLPDIYHVFDPDFMGDTSGDHRCRLYEIGAPYVFYKGSVRVKFAPTDVVSENPVISADTTPTLAAPLAPFSTNVVNLVGMNYSQQFPMAVAPIAEVRLPYYRSNVMMPRTSLNLASQRNRVAFWMSDSTQMDGKMYVAGGDDFSFGFLVGAPLLAQQPVP